MEFELHDLGQWFHSGFHSEYLTGQITVQSGIDRRLKQFWGRKKKYMYYPIYL